ncbi:MULTISPECIES: hypothetical protein [Nocardiaceae]|nr:MULTISPECIES: hypothetical protein [Rhodococcus]
MSAPVLERPLALPAHQRPLVEIDGRWFMSARSGQLFPVTLVK